MKLALLIAQFATIAAVGAMAVQDPPIGATSRLAPKSTTPLPRKALTERVRPQLSPAAFTFVGNSWRVSPGAPYLEGKGYMRAQSGSPDIVVDARADGLGMPSAGPNVSLQLYVHGLVGHPTVIDCAMEGVDVLETSVELVGDAARPLAPDPQGRRWSSSVSGGHLVLAIPADVPGLSATNWFAVNLISPRPLNGQAAPNVTFYGCDISLVQ